MIEFASWFKGAGLDEILLFLFVAVGAGFIKVLLFLGKNLKEQHDAGMSQQAEVVNAVVKRFEKAVDMIGERLEKLDASLNQLTEVVIDFKAEVTGELNRVEMRVALAEKDIEYHSQQLLSAVERRKAQRE